MPSQLTSYGKTVGNAFLQFKYIKTGLEVVSSYFAITKI